MRKPVRKKPLGTFFLEKFEKSLQRKRVGVRSEKHLSVTFVNL